MDNLLNIAYNVVLPVFLCVGVGALIGRRYSPDPRVLSTLLIYLFTPFLVLDSLAHSALRADEIGQIGVVVVALALAMWAVGAALARGFRFDRKLESAFLLTVILINAGNYGIPVNTFAFGDAGGERALVYYVVSAVVANTLGVYVASRGSDSVRQSLMNVFKVPLPYAAILGLAINFGNVTLPVPVDRAVSLLGQAAVPGMLTLLGLQLARASVRGRLQPILLAAGSRLIVAPLIAVGIAAALGMTGLTRQVCIVQSGMPSAVMSGVLATEFGSDAEFTSAVIVVSTLASLATLSVLLALVQI